MVGIVAVIARVASSTAALVANAALAAEADAPSIMTRRRIAIPIPRRIVFVCVFIAIVRGP